ncbi:DUF2523 domain-containing protein [Thiohalomonas denitrificans]|uniref:DUF2523 domain-containing protein n=1 Tax=Thiohalomonas denitrificans TaxID=415747 RepID=A0A1G5PTQ5_9GAMM|nr:DUF2523 domain-containing protein [Thiohalomonas denitrificans]SCZ52954.1 Protein of unknown function [Thiohalomonas denitrificans]
MALPVIGMFWGSLLTLIAPLVYKVVAALGLGFVTYLGLSYVMDELMSYMQGALSGLPSEMLAMVALLKIDQAIALIVSAFSVRAAISGWSGGKKTGSVWQPPGGKFPA